MSDDAKPVHHAPGGVPYTNRAEMALPENRHAVALLAALSQRSDFSVGCYCESEAHCHRSVLRELLAEQGADMVDSPGSNDAK